MIRVLSEYLTRPAFLSASALVLLFLPTLAVGQSNCEGVRVIEVGFNHVSFCCNLTRAWAFEANDPLLYQAGVPIRSQYALNPIFNRSLAEILSLVTSPLFSAGVLVPLYPSSLFTDGAWYVVCGEDRSGCTACVPVRACTTCSCQLLLPVINATVGLVPLEPQDAQDSVRVASWIDHLSDFGSLRSTITWLPYFCQGTQRLPTDTDSPASCPRPSLSFNSAPRVVKSEDIVTGMDGPRTFTITLDFLMYSGRIGDVFSVGIDQFQVTPFATLTGTKTATSYTPVNFTASLRLPYDNSFSDAVRDWAFGINVVRMWNCKCRRCDRCATT